MTTPTTTEPQPSGRHGRPSLLTPELQQKIVTVVRAGNYLKVAAQFNGVGESTLKGWLQRGRAAAALRDAHDPEHLYCPGCDADRTAAVREETDANEAEEERYQAALAAHQADPKGTPEPEGRAYAVLNRCPSCFSEDRPRPWELPEAEVRYLDFLAAVTQAETAAEVAAVTHWRAAFADDWRAARDFLVRKNPASWAATTRVTISQDEAERRIDNAAEQVLLAVGVDTDNLGTGHLLSAGEDPNTLDLDGDWADDGDVPDA